MKKNLKKLSLLLAALTLSSALASAASAGAIFKGYTNNASDSAVESVSDKTSGNKVTTKPGGSPVVQSSGNKNFVSTKPPKSDDCDKPSSIVIRPNYSCDLVGGIFYSPEDAADLLEKYFDENTYEINLTEGEKYTLCEGAYFYSTDPDVVYYDYKTGRLAAKDNGTADVYLYTAGGIPFFRLDVNVQRKVTVNKAVSLDVVAEDWNLSVGDETKLTVTASDGKVYDDIKYTIWYGNDRATVTQLSGKVSAKKNGVVVVHAYSESKSYIKGDAILYIGDIGGAVADGCWNKYEGGIHISGWKDNICDYYYTANNIKGWIKSAEGILIPVIKFEEATVDRNGELVETTILTGGKYSLATLLKDIYGKDESVNDIIRKYNLLKYGISCDKDYYVFDDIDMKTLVLSQLIKDIIG